MRASYKDWEKEEKLLLLEAWSRNGLSNADIAHNIGINECTLYDWIRNHSKISKALKNGKEVADIRVENALYKRAIGFKTKEITKSLVKDPETGKKRMMTVSQKEKEVAGDTVAQIFWLKNRRPDIWKNKEQVEVNTEDSGGIVMLTPEDKSLLKDAMHKLGDEKAE